MRSVGQYLGGHLVCITADLPLLHLHSPLDCGSLAGQFHRSPMSGFMPIGFAATKFSYTLSGYLSDSYTIYASSGLAVQGFLRALASGCLPLFAYPIYSGLGSNIATSIIAAVATLFCVTPYIFLTRGKRLKKNRPFARYSAKVNDQRGADWERDWTMTFNKRALLFASMWLSLVKWSFSTSLSLRNPIQSPYLLSTFHPRC